MPLGFCERLTPFRSEAEEVRQFHRGFASRAFHCLFQRMSESIERLGGSDVWFSSSWVDGPCPEREIWEPDIDLPESSYLPSRISTTSYALAFDIAFRHTGQIILLQSK